MHDCLGSLAWVIRTGGRLTTLERLSLLIGGIGAVGEGLGLALLASRSEHRKVPMETIAPPDTPMVRKSREFLEAHADRTMINHSYRTGYWTVAVLGQHVPLTTELVETAWVAALLHDVGLELPLPEGDFTLGGVAALRTLASEHGWLEPRVVEAADAIATNLSTRVDARKLGMVAWAMNVGGLGELGFPPHRAQWHGDRVAELEERYPRDGFREAAMLLIAEEAKRVPDGRFALLGRFFPLIMRP